MLLFDNGWHIMQPPPSPGVRVLEFNPRTEEVVWSHEMRPTWDFFSSFIKGAQRLPNDNTLICQGINWQAVRSDPRGKIVWKYVNPFFGDDGRFGRVNLVFRASG